MPSEEATPLVGHKPPVPLGKPGEQGWVSPGRTLESTSHPSGYRCGDALVALELPRGTGRDAIAEGSVTRPCL